MIQFCCAWWSYSAAPFFLSILILNRPLFGISKILPDHANKCSLNKHAPLPNTPCRDHSTKAQMVFSRDLKRKRDLLAKVQVVESKHLLPNRKEGLLVRGRPDRMCNSRAWSLSFPSRHPAAKMRSIRVGSRCPSNLLLAPSITRYDITQGDRLQSRNRSPRS